MKICHSQGVGNHISSNHAQNVWDELVNDQIDVAG